MQSLSNQLHVVSEHLADRHPYRDSPFLKVNKRYNSSSHAQAQGGCKASGTDVLFTSTDDLNACMDVTTRLLHKQEGLLRTFGDRQIPKVGLATQN